MQTKGNLTLWQGRIRQKGITLKRTSPLGMIATKLTIIIVGLAQLVIGCSGVGQDRASRPVHLILATDTSGGCLPYLPAFAALESDIVAGLDPDRDTVAAYRMDDRTQCYYDDGAPESADDFDELLIKDLSTPAAKPGTYSALCWTTICQKAKTTPDDQEVVVMTDGDNDDASPASSKAIRVAAKGLATNRHVLAVAIVGVASEDWQTLSDEFAPLGEKRFRIFGRTQVTAEDVERFLSDARKGADDNGAQ